MAFSLESHRNYILWWSLSSLSSGLINRGRIVPRNNWIINVFIIKFIYPHLLTRRRTRIFSVSQCVRALFGWMLHWLWIDSENYRTISSTAHNSAIATAAAAAATTTFVIRNRLRRRSHAHHSSIQLLSSHSQVDSGGNGFDRIAYTQSVALHRSFICRMCTAGRVG